MAEPNIVLYRVVTRPQQCYNRIERGSFEPETAANLIDMGQYQSVGDVISIIERKGYDLCTSNCFTIDHKGDDAPEIVKEYVFSKRNVRLTAAEKSDVDTLRAQVQQQAEKICAIEQTVEILQQERHEAQTAARLEKTHSAEIMEEIHSAEIVAAAAQKAQASLRKEFQDRIEAFQEELKQLRADADTIKNESLAKLSEKDKTLQQKDEALQQMVQDLDKIESERDEVKRSLQMIERQLSVAGTVSS